MTPPDLLLIAGYPVALVVLARLRSVFRERRTTWFVAEEAASAAIALGWALKGRAEGAAVNALWATALGAAWVFSRRRRQREREPVDLAASTATPEGGAPESM